MQELSIYIHFPFCELKCPYCDFNSHVANDFKENKLLLCYKKEIDLFLSKLNEKRKLRSIFFGGGTPSLMKPETVHCILRYIFDQEQLLILPEEVEITLEANPSSSEYQKFVHFKEAGVNRLSIGIQSLNPIYLKFLGRKHNSDEAKSALLMAKEIFDQFSFDLIYCLPGQTLTEWQKELEFAVQNYAKNHISAYILTIEKGTPFFKMHQNNEFLLPEKEDEFYVLTNDILKSYAFERYEISNYARNENYAKHNLSYWKSIDYLGIGPGAHGRITVNKQRYSSYNYADPVKYATSVLSNGNAFQNFDILEKVEVIKEILVMNLRTSDGIDICDIKNRLGLDLLSELSTKSITTLQNNGLVSLNEKHLKLTESGLNIADSVIKKLLP